MTYGFGTGWKQNETDHRDYPYEATAEADPEADLTYHLHGCYFHQGGAPSCVGFGCAHQLIMKNGELGLNRPRPSPAYIYYWARYLYRHDVKITGSYPRFAYKAIQKLGVCPEANWPYQDHDIFLIKQPTDEARRNAMGWANLEYRSITGLNKANKVRRALSAGDPVGFGTLVTKSWYGYRPGQILRPDGDPQGGHFVCIGGYKDDRFKIVNSWPGKEIMWLHESYIESPWSGDFTVLNNVGGYR